MRYENYLRAEVLPTIWCPGCGNGIVVKAFATAMSRLALDPRQVVVAGGIGCSGRTPLIMDCNTMHTTHGRALAFATGVKLARPQLTVMAVMGDGDAAAIGGNHLIHACRRNIDITAIIFNNSIYGLTGGQCSPTTPKGARTSTSYDGNIEPAFDLCSLALGVGAAFVARTTVYDFEHMADMLQKAIAFRGFSVVEVLTTCPTYFGRINPPEDAHDMLHQLKVKTTENGTANGSHSNGQSHPSNGHAESEFASMPIGIFRNEERPEYTAMYARLVSAAREEAAAGA